MRKVEREIKDRAELEDVIRKAEVCHLAMVDDGRPYIVPMNFGYREGVFYFHCAREGRKLEVLRDNPQVCFEMEAGVHLMKGDAACGWSTSYESVIGWGIAEIIMDEHEVRAGLEVLMSHYTAGPYDFDQRSLSLTALIKVKVERMTGKRSKR